jgi:Spy/CpxP family protein refolding chaperone
MRRLIASLVILLFVTSLSFAQGMMQQKKGRMGMMGGMHHMYSMMIHHVLMKASALNLTDAQKKELANIQEKYLYPMVRKEADFKISHMKTMDMLQDPNFDPVKVKAEAKVSSDISLEMANMSIDALAAIRKAIGVENFKKVKGMMPMMGGGMMSGSMMEGETMKKEPAEEKKEDSSSEHKEHHEAQ